MRVKKNGYYEKGERSAGEREEAHASATVVPQGLILLTWFLSPTKAHALTHSQKHPCTHTHTHARTTCRWTFTHPLNPGVRTQALYLHIYTHACSPYSFPLSFPPQISPSRIYTWTDFKNLFFPFFRLLRRTRNNLMLQIISHFKGQKSEHVGNISLRC